MAIPLPGDVKEKAFSTHAKSPSVGVFLWGWWEILCTCDLPPVKSLLGHHLYLCVSKRWAEEQRELICPGYHTLLMA